MVEPVYLLGIIIIALIIVAFVMFTIPRKSSEEVPYVSYTYVPGDPQEVSPAKGIVLVTQFYLPQSERRREELLFCFRENIKCMALSRIVFLVESEEDRGLFHRIFGYPERVTLVRSHLPRPTFGDYFNVGAREVGKDDVLLVANSDIVFDQTIAKARYIRPDEALALTRWELRGQNRPFHGELKASTVYSSDVWAIRGEVSSALTKLTYCPGVWACDNVLIGDLVTSGYQVFNPYQAIHIYHVHDSEERQAHPSNPVPGVRYKIVAPPLTWDPRKM